MISVSTRSLFILMFLMSIVIYSGNLCGGEYTPAIHGNPESEAHAIIERVYLEVLQRYPDEGGLKTYLKFLVDERKSEEWLRAVLLKSEEGQQVRKQNQERMYILYSFATLPLLSIGVAFYFRKSTKEFIFNFLFLFFYIGIACLFLEIALRMTAMYQVHLNKRANQNLVSSLVPQKNATVGLRDIVQLSANPKLVYEIMPSLSVSYIGGEVTTGLDGFRITPGACDKPATYTILGLGDSVMFGRGVHDQETYLAYLAKNMSYDCSRIINMAVPGYNTVMEVEAFEEKGLQFQPDLVIIHFVDNDLHLPEFIRKKDKYVTQTHSYLIEALSRWQGARIRVRSFDHLVRNPVNVPEEYQYMVGIEAFHRKMVRLKELGRKHDFKILLLADFAASEYITDITSELMIPVIELGKLFQHYIREHGFQGSVLTINNNDPHYSPLAHRIVAEEVYQFLLKNNYRTEEQNAEPGKIY